MRHSLRLATVFAVTALLAAVFAASAGAYGGGSSHDTWQIGLSFNCDNPTLCGGGGGGFWGWAEFDRYADGTITGDAQLTGCGHSGPGGGPHSAGAGHFDVDATSAHIGPAQPGDPTFNADPTLNGQTFYIDSNVVNGVADDPDFLGDTGIPTAPGHYSGHDAPGISQMINVSFRAAR